MPITRAVSVIGIMLATFIILILAVRTVRRMKARDDTPIGSLPAFDLAELQAMLQAGQLTLMEFERLERIMIAAGSIRQQPSPRGFDVLPREKRPE